jgi:signal transduction histidine kinase
MPSEVSTPSPDQSVQELKRELAEARQQQAATADVLRVISRSPTDLQQVLDTIVETGQKLVNSYDAAIILRDGDGMRVRAHNGPIPMRTEWPTLNRGSVAARSVLDRAAVHVHDLSTAGTEFPEGQAYSHKLGHRTILAVPLLLKGEAIGTMVVRRKEVRPFTDKESELLRTFADQAVIAIENTRLFEAEQASKRELQESLEYQTATSEVLGVISRSTFDLQPVLEAVVESATRLCGATRGHIFRVDGDFLRFAAAYGAWPGFAEYLERRPVRLGVGTVAGRAGAECRTIHVPDVLLEPDYAYGELLKQQGYRTVLAVPMRREGSLLGVIAILKTHVEPFTRKQIELVETFADQAIIAIENARLFEEVQARTRELQESLEHQTATSDVLSVISRSKFDLQPVLDTIANTAARLCGGVMAGVFRFDGQLMHLGAMVNFGPEGEDITRQNFPRAPSTDTAAGKAIVEGAVVIVTDVDRDRRDDWARELARTGRYRSAMAAPMLREGIPVGAIVVCRAEAGPFPEGQVEVLKTFADQAVIAIENTRLFDEIAQKSRDLEIASQHKSQFVANMSHELRTPLAAILGYAELMQEGFYEPLGQKSLDALTRIRANGKHLLGLINTVLDIAKIESGQFSLNLAEYALSNMVETVRAATESLAETKKLALMAHVPKSLPVGFGDEQRLTQVLLNLVGNAIKFTDTGEVRITAKAENGHFAVSVADTGPGIPADQLTRVFEQFHQVDSSNTKAKGGTGLGLAISKQIVEMHGGRIWVESLLGKGSTFHMELPVRAATGGAA